MTHIVLPQFANSLGNVFGGQIMAWVDICAAVAAQRHCRSQVVTASIDAVHFIAPVKVGHILLLRGQVNAAFTTSVECGITVISENPLTGETHKAAKAYATFVALDEEGCPRKVPGLIAVTEDDKRRVRDAQDRRAQRLALRKAQEQRAHEQEEKGL
jgi:acyl-CoA hydrolase